MGNRTRIFLCKWMYLRMKLIEQKFVFLSSIWINIDLLSKIMLNPHLYKASLLSLFAKQKKSRVSIMYRNQLLMKLKLHVINYVSIFFCCCIQLFIFLIHWLFFRVMLHTKWFQISVGTWPSPRRTELWTEGWPSALIKVNLVNLLINLQILFNWNKFN